MLRSRNNSFVKRSFGPLLAALIVFATALPTVAEPRDLPEIQEKGVIRIALYNDFAPYSARGKGIDFEIAEALAKKLQVKLDPLWFNADENVDDDLRNMVWKGHYLGIGPADAMIHAPIDPELARRNPRVRMVAPYYRERLAIARDLKALPKIEDMKSLEGIPLGAEDASLASIVLISENGGSLRSNVRHYKTPAAAVDALKKGEVAAVMAQQGELQGLLNGASAYAVAPPPVIAGLGTRQWVLGLAVKKDHSALGDALEKAMTELAAEGELEKIFARYGVERTKP